MAVPYIPAWRVAICESDLDSSSKLTAYTLSFYWNSKGECPEPWGPDNVPGAGPSIATLSKGTSLSRRTVQAAIDKLESGSWIRRTHEGGGRANTHRWIATTPEGDEPPPPSKPPGRFEDLA